MEENLYFEKLTLNDSVDIKVYEEALNFAFSSPDIKNIAISGAYGAGKSSVLASYKKKHNEKKFMHISLAHFEEEFCNIPKDDIKESVLEGKILNQLIHQISPNDIPQTNFKVKQDVSKKQVIKGTILLFLSLICATFIALHSAWSNFVSEFSGVAGIILSVSLSPYVRLLFGLVLLIVLYLLLYQFIELQKNKKLFKRINVQGTEIEVFENKDESYFDKYLNEVLYLFENTGVDAIVFEDMDRFEMNRIFERLREVNILVNIQLRKRNNKVLRFIYLLRDDVFVSKDRTKFFDYIVPIVPVLDGTNSYDQFISHLQKNDMYSKLNEKFLQGLSLYVDDMRLLKNICNEFLIYYNRINTTELDCNKMFALITYKNLFPRDFSDLQLGRGFINAIFSQKSNFIKNEVDRIKSLIENKNEEIEFYDKENLLSLEELECVKRDKQNKIHNMSYGQQRNKKQAEYDEWCETEFPKRKKAIEDKNDNRLSLLQKELDDLKIKLLKVQSASLKQIITRDNVDEIFKISTINEIGDKADYTEIKGNEYFALLKYLVRNGYIDESYADYMTYFYENSISRVDKIFLRSVTDKKAKESTYELKDPALVVSRLDISDFEEKELLNFYLLKYLLEEMPNSQQLSQLIQQISSSHNIDFIRQFFSYFREWAQYVSKLNVLWPSFFKEIIESNSYKQEMIHDYSVYSLYFSKRDELSSINIDNCLANYIINSPAYLKIENPDIDKLISVFQHLNVKFRTIDFAVSNNELFKEIYTHSLYELNFANIKLMLAAMEGIDSKECILHKNYSLVMDNTESPLFEYINSNIERYMLEVLENCGGYIEDNSTAVVQLLNNTSISNKTKITYISSLKTKVDRIAVIDDIELWDYCLNNNIIEFSEINIVSYFYSKKCFSPSLIHYINAFPQNIDMRIADIQEDSFKSELFEACLKCFDINNDKYKQILSSMNRAYKNDFPVENVPDVKMQILIDCGIIKLTEKSIETIRENYPDICDYFIEKNFESYVAVMNPDVFLLDELMRILEWNVPDEMKISLLKFTFEPISILNKSWASPVKVHILKNNLDEDDLIHLRKNYHTQDDEIKKLILNNALENISQIIETSTDISYYLIEDILISTQVQNDIKFSLISETLDKFSREQCLHLFELMGRNDYVSIFESRKKPKFLVCEENETILEKFKNNGWIYDYYIDSNDETYYRIRRHRPSQKLKTELL